MIQNAVRPIIVISFVCGASLCLCPAGNAKRVLSVMCTATLCSAVFQPFFSLDFDALSRWEASFQSAESGILHNGKQSEEFLRRIALRELCENYLAEKASALGLSTFDCEIEIRSDSEGRPYPYAAVIRSSASPEAARTLSEALRGDLGIPEERQVWLSDE